MKQFSTYQKWYEEYEKDLCVIFTHLMSVLKRKNMVYKQHSFETFCKLIYKKSSKY